MIEVIESLRCRSCGRLGSILCRPCHRAMQRPPRRTLPSEIDRVVAGTAYEGVARALVLELKLRGIRAAAGPLATAALRAVHRDGCVAGRLTWVPGRRADIVRRGFDHAYLIARCLGRELGLPVEALLERTGSRRDQTELGRRERMANLEGAFVARGPVLGGVAVVDDLVTTGATAAACARALKLEGATSVEVISACLV